MKVISDVTAEIKGILGCEHPSLPSEISVALWSTMKILVIT